MLLAYDSVHYQSHSVPIFVAYYCDYCCCLEDELNVHVHVYVHALYEPHLHLQSHLQHQEPVLGLKT